MIRYISSLERLLFFFILELVDSELARVLAWFLCVHDKLQVSYFIRT